MARIYCLYTSTRVDLYHHQILLTKKNSYGSDNDLAPYSQQAMWTSASIVYWHIRFIRLGPLHKQDRNNSAES